MKSQLDSGQLADRFAGSALVLPMLATSKSLVAPLLLVVLYAANNFVAHSQTASQNLEQKGLKVESASGKQTFSSTCAGCHGLDGKGSERAPSIADRPNVQRLSDSQIFRIIENGIPGTGMPAFHSLERSQIKAVVTYLRTLQGTKKTVKLPGSPERGKTSFIGPAGCSECHMVAGQGGFIASDLSGYARIHTVEQIRSAIVQPTVNGDRQARLVTATTHGGEKYVGRIRNEDNFSLQLQGLDGAFHFLSKSDLEGLEYNTQALGHSDYGSSLTPGELNDVTSYLISIANSASLEIHRKNEEE